MDRLQLRSKLALLGVHRVECEYSGGGDSGAVDAIKYFNAADEEVQFENDEMKRTLEELFWDLTTEREGGWYNSDGVHEGGSGNMRWHIPTDELRHHHMNHVLTAYPEDYEGWPDAS